MGVCLFVCILKPVGYLKKKITICFSYYEILIILFLVFSAGVSHTSILCNINTDPDWPQLFHLKVICQVLSDTLVTQTHPRVARGSWFFSHDFDNQNDFPSSYPFYADFEYTWCISHEDFQCLCQTALKAVQPTIDYKYACQVTKLSLPMNRLILIIDDAYRYSLLCRALFCVLYRLENGGGESLQVHI